MLVSLLAIALSAATSAAAQPQVTLLPWAELGYAPPAEDARAQGPERLSAGPGGRAAFYDSVRREVLLLEDDALVLGFPVRHVSDLLLSGSAVVVLDTAAREIASWSLSGQLRARLRVPDLVPTGITLELIGDQLHGVDMFGNLHPLATLAGGDLSPPQAQALMERSPAVTWAEQVMATEGLRIPLPAALKASGQRLGDWLVVDAVIADDPIQVDRHAWPIGGGPPLALPVAERLYAPNSDIAATPEGELLVMVPVELGLEIWRVKP